MVEKLIITAAITGAITVPAQTPYLPITPQQIAEESARARDAGAAIVHIHVRNPENGMPTSDLQIFGETLALIKAKTDAVICTSTGGGLGMTIEQRVAVVPTYQPEMASFNMGSINFALHPLLKRIKEFKYPWEAKYLEMSRDFVFKNTFADLEYVLKTMKDSNTRPELEIYDVGHLYNTHYLVQEGLLELPLHMQFVMGVLGGIEATFDDLMHLKRTADRLFGDQYTWSVIGVGYPAEFHLGTLGAMMGGHVRVGLEDNIRIAKGTLAKSNAELVEKMVRIARELGREVASPDEARKMLGLKGREKVKF